MTDSHRPVMLEESLAGLSVRAMPDAIYVDGTFGRGGHSAAILDVLGAQGFLHAMDQDPDAVTAAKLRFGERGNFRIHHRNFGELGELARDCGMVGQISGILLDLGVSSPQFDDAERGFSFLRDGPLDMRMDPSSGEPASAWINRADAEEIADVLYQYGEERLSRRIARRIVEARIETPILRTTQLADIISRAMSGPRQKIHPATRSFQAIRIFINRELDVLPRALQSAAEVLAPGGRLAVISFHSLEDRIVKRFMRDARGTGPDDAKKAELKRVSRAFPSDAECAINPRARSAVLRVAERVS
ncbi:16S rRNA (cytosine(1402)-N(4))-methyltransferase RsmH [Hydrocarboniphaga sp.]|uniref:16S rRNA (cytosine(1402)-N(4))-methyltransferase RsmH n=1 Tax=Hydrocarboniphaga sp. TaxID=2033016 RepID=UPI002614EFED|nr:16S rRNA (cytosine(1402)-N(4))-methyltransferase RsmH [Hydrocarboniphaga sp.]